MKNETEKMRKLYDQWQTQGISKQAFCNHNGMGYHKFNYWVKKFRRENVPIAAPTRGFCTLFNLTPTYTYELLISIEDLQILT